MAIIFFGTPHFAVPSLQALIDTGEDIALVVTQPDKAKGRGHLLSAPPVKERALSYSLPVDQPQKIRNEEFYTRLRALDPEFIVVVAYGKIIPKEILDIPKRGCINVHASLLPKYRGAAPIQWALINGEKVTGVTTMLMDEGIDTGDILIQKELEISPDDTAATLSEKLASLGAKALPETLEGLRKGTILPRTQQGEATYAPQLKKEDGKIDWTRSAEALASFVRGMSPWPSAYTFFNGETIKIVKGRPISGEGQPGRVEKASAGQLLVGTGKGLFSILELQPEGKKVMPAAAFLAGRMVREGHDQFS